MGASQGHSEVDVKSGLVVNISVRRSESLAFKERKAAPPLSHYQDVLCWIHWH